MKSKARLAPWLRLAMAMATCIAFLLGMLVAAAPAGAVTGTTGVTGQTGTCSPSCTWTGAAYNTSGTSTYPDSNWSTATNWNVGAPTPGTATDYTFPDLSSSLPACENTSSAPTTSCYESNNDLAGVQASSLTTDGPYDIFGNTITLAGNLTETGQQCSGSGACGGADIQTPLTLTGAGQTWSFSTDSNANGSSNFQIIGGVTGSSTAVTANFTNAPGLDLEKNVDVGLLTFNGNGTSGPYSGGYVDLSPGFCGTATPPNPPPLCGPPSLNGNSGHPVSFTGGLAFTAGSGGTTGPLSISDSSLGVGQPAYPGTGTGAGVLNVNGPLAIDSSSQTQLFIAQAGTTAGTDYSQVNAAGAASVDGSLYLDTQTPPGPGTTSCPTLNPGDVLTLVKSSGALTGTFSNAPDGSTIPVECGYAPNNQSVRINYTPNSVTATVLGDTTTTLSVSPSSSVSTGQSVTYTATVAPTQSASAEPSGTVQFADGDSPISGCSSQPLTQGSSSSTATCTISYGSPGSHSITASYGGDSNFNGSVSSAQTVTVQSPPSSNPAPPAPTATTNAATAVGTTIATLNGVVDTKGQAVTWQFQYGESTNYNKATPIQTIAAGKTSPVPVSWKLVNLQPLTVYHFRAVAITQGSSGQSPVYTYGQDLTFTTKSTGKLLLSFSSLKLSGNAVKVPLKCSSKLKCTGRFSITTKAKVGKKKKLASVLCDTTFFTTKAGKTTKVKARIYGACMTLLRHAHGHKIKAQFTSRPRTGQFGLIKNITLIL